MSRFRVGLIVLLGMAILVAPSVALAEDYEAVKTWPKMPRNFEFGEVAGVGVDSHNHVFVFHRGAKKPIIAFDGATGLEVLSFGEGMFGNAHGLFIDNNDNVWVTDNGHHQVFKFTHDGELLMTVGEKGVTGWDETHFNQPTDIVVTGLGEFYVTDGYVNSRVAKFSANGEFEFEWGTKGTEDGQFNLPHGIARDKSGRIYVADRSNKRVQVFDAQGNHLQTWGEGVFGEKGRPWGLEIADDDNLYVIDGGQVTATADHARIMKLDLTGKLLSQWSSYGPSSSQLQWGHDVAVGKDGAHYTAEVRYNNRSQKWIPAK